ncbi:tc3a_0 protein [Trichonephila clavipes]|nr:tc3a_0 protein [Trichonephila clavipes]
MGPGKRSKLSAGFKIKVIQFSKENGNRAAARIDEAHFWLNGYVNKQNCRIWNEANPQVCVEMPLHPEKLTVWCALSAGGILLQKR